MKNRNFFQSLKCAVKGLIYMVKTEPNFRLELLAGVGVTAFAIVYGLSREQWAILAVTIFAVLCAETVNTSIERAVDTATSKICESAMRAKDAASGAVTLMSVGAVAVGAALFTDVSKLKNTFFTIIHSAPIMIFAALIIILGIIFVKRSSYEKKQ